MITNPETGSWAVDRNSRDLAQRCGFLRSRQVGDSTAGLRDLRTACRAVARHLQLGG